MHDTLTTPLPGSWLSSRLGVNPREIEQLRDRGELFAVRDHGEWLYPAWQFGPGGSVPAGVREAVKTARAVGLDEARLVALLRRPAGLLWERPGSSICSSRAAPTSSWRPFAARQRHEPRTRPAYAGPVRILLVSQMYPGLTRRTSGRSSHRSSASSRRAATRSSWPSSTRVRAGSFAI